LVDWSRAEEIEEEHVKMFIREEVFLDLIIDLDESMLDSLKISKIGTRKKLMSSAARLKVTLFLINGNIQSATSPKNSMGLLEGPQLSVT
jgi:hypothetical protein